MDDRSVKKSYLNERLYDDVGGQTPICGKCLHRGNFIEEKGMIECRAFPKGIPRDILITCDGERDITKECNNGIKYEPKEEG